MANIFSYNIGREPYISTVNVISDFAHISHQKSLNLPDVSAATKRPQKSHFQLVNINIKLLSI